MLIIVYWLITLNKNIKLLIIVYWLITLIKHIKLLIIVYWLITLIIHIKLGSSGVNTVNALHDFDPGTRW